MIKKFQNNYPVINLESEDGELIAFDRFGAFRMVPAYKYSLEHSIYIHQDFREKGLEHILLKLLIQAAKDQNYHTIMACINADNQGSIALQEKHGFKHVGTLPEVGFKFGN